MFVPREKRFRLRLLAVVLAGLLYPAPLARAEQRLSVSNEERQDTMETRVFDIRSLLLEVPDYRAVFSDLRSDDIYGPPPPGRQPSDSIFSEPETESETVRERPNKNAEVLMGTIQGIIAPRSWRNLGGDLGAMYFYGGQLVVSSTPEVVAEIERLLDLLKDSRSLKLRLDAYFVAVLLDAKNAEVGDLRNRTEFAPDEFHKLLADHPELASVTRASVSGFDGQRVFTTAGRQYSVFVGTEPIVAQGSAAYHPLARQLVSGVTLEVQSVLDQARATVLVDLRASLGHLTPTTEPEPAPIDPLAVGGSVPPYQVAHFATSVSVPIDRFSLIGSARYDDDHDVMLFVMPSRE